jgi:hypothetical protein
MARPADHEGFPAFAGHDVHPLVSIDVPGPGKIGEFADLMDFDISVLLADLTHAPEKSFHDLPVAVQGDAQSRSCWSAVV